MIRASVFAALAAVSLGAPSARTYTPLVRSLDWASLLCSDPSSDPPASPLVYLSSLVAVPVSKTVNQLVPELGGPQVPDAQRVCSKSGEKCAGSVGFPAVVYKGCCDNRLVCAVPKNMPAGTWGRFCVSDSMAAPESATTTVAATTVAGGTTVKGASTVAAPTTAAGATTGAGATPVAGGSTVASSTTEVLSATGTSETTTKKTGGTVADTTTTASNKTSDGSACFPAGATVELASGKTVRMDEVSIGDVVKVGVNEYSRVFMFTHKMSEVVNKFVTLKTESGASLALTMGHYLYVNGALVSASNVNVGDVLALGDGQTSAVVAVGFTSGVGLFNPQTVNGNIVVNGIVSSTYTTAVEPTFAHAILAPFRMLNNFGFSFTALESGGGVLADIAPRGQVVF
jgi:Hint module